MKEKIGNCKSFLSGRKKLQLEKNIDFFHLFLDKVLQIYVVSFWEMEKLLLREKRGKLVSFY